MIGIPERPPVRRNELYCALLMSTTGTTLALLTSDDKELVQGVLKKWLAASADEYGACFFWECDVLSSCGACYGGRIQRD